MFFSVPDDRSLRVSTVAVTPKMALSEWEFDGSGVVQCGLLGQVSYTVIDLIGAFWQVESGL